MSPDEPTHDTRPVTRRKFLGGAAAVPVVCPPVLDDEKGKRGRDERKHEDEKRDDKPLPGGGIEIYVVDGWTNALVEGSVTLSGPGVGGGEVASEPAFEGRATFDPLEEAGEYFIDFEADATEHVISDAVSDATIDYTVESISHTVDVYEPPERHDLTVTILDAEDGFGIPNVDLSAVTGHPLGIDVFLAGETDDDGVAELTAEGHERTTYEVRIAEAGWEERTVEITIGEDDGRVIELERSGDEFFSLEATIEVVDPDGEPLVGELVEVAPAGAEDQVETHSTDANGQVVIGTGSSDPTDAVMFLVTVHGETRTVHADRFNRTYTFEVDGPGP